MHKSETRGSRPIQNMAKYFRFVDNLWLATNTLRNTTKLFWGIYIDNLWLVTNTLSNATKTSWGIYQEM